MDYHQRQEVINSVGGNSMAWIIDEQDEEQYLCECCSSFVSSKRWNANNKICDYCINEEE